MGFLRQLTNMLTQKGNRNGRRKRKGIGRQVISQDGDTGKMLVPPWRFPRHKAGTDTALARLVWERAYRNLGINARRWKR